MNIKLVFIFCALLIMMGISCSDSNPNSPNDSIDSGEYELLVKYDSIRSYPGGGGIFPIKINPLEGFDGKVILRVVADRRLNAIIRNDTLNKNLTIANLIISPDSNISISDTQILLIASHAGREKEILLNVEIFNWESGEFETSDDKLTNFRDWAINRGFDFSELLNDDTFKYRTYPEILIVEHSTYISEKYEVRICYHVMIPPHDWSMILIRPLNSVEAVKSARRESDGTISEIPVSEYPILLGY